MCHTCVRMRSLPRKNLYPKPIRCMCICMLARMLSEQAQDCSRYRSQARVALAAAEAPISFAVRDATAVAKRKARDAAAAEEGAPAAPTFRANPVPESSRQQVSLLPPPDLWNSCGISSLFALQHRHAAGAEPSLTQVTLMSHVLRAQTWPITDRAVSAFARCAEQAPHACILPC